MQRTFLSIMSLIALVLGLTACSTASSVAETIKCTGDFEATVYQGPSAGLSLIGPLALEVDATGNLTGALTTNNGTFVQVTGQAVGRSINLVFNLGEDKRIFGVGSLENDIRDCTGLSGGPFTGPEPGDSGDWGYGIGGRS
ncbi:MAG: hypothetical protein KJ077_45330 [Anaerolineae bacterium]|nr:hypothetical protein [Anaerolineae bacterium]